MRQGTLLVVLVLLCGCTESEPVTVGPEDRRAVTEALLRKVLAGPPERPLFRRQADVTSWFSDLESWQSRSELKPGTVASFVAANEPGTMHGDWLGTLGVGLVSEADYRAHFGHAGLRDLDAGWESVLRGPPECTVVVTLSAPGFSSDGSQALLGMGAGSGSLEGNGGLYLLERQGGGWVVSVALSLWVS